MIDTIKISAELQESGLPEKQADAIAQALLEVPQMAQLATKVDLSALETSLTYRFVIVVALGTLLQIAASFLHK